eukprot:scaffold21051_cov58-Cyclotella_meneghiniana.AAC.6
MMNLTGIISDDHHFFGNRRSQKPPALDINTNVDLPPVSASSPIRCSPGGKDRPPGWRNLVDKRLQKGPLSPITSLTVNKSVQSGAKTNDKYSSSSKCVADKANAAYKKKKKHVTDELKRQSSLSATAYAVASSPKYIADLNEQMKAIEMKRTSSLTSLPQTAPSPKQNELSAQSRFVRAYEATESRSSLAANITIENAEVKVAIGPRRTSTGSSGHKFFPTIQQQLSDESTYHEPSPMCRLRNNNTESNNHHVVANTSLMRYQDLTDENVIQKVHKDVHVISNLKVQDANVMRNGKLEGPSVTRKAKINHQSSVFGDGMVQKDASVMSSGEKHNSVCGVYVTSTGDLNEGIDEVKNTQRTKEEQSPVLAASAMVSNRYKSVTQKSNGDVNAFVPIQNLLAFKNRDFGKTGRSLLTETDPRIEIKKCLSGIKTKIKKSRKVVLKTIRRADKIQGHSSNVGSTLKSIGIDLEKPMVYSRATKKELPKPPGSAKKKKNLSTIIGMSYEYHLPDSHRRQVYEYVRGERCILLQRRRGVAVPQVREVSYQRYSFLERKRRGILVSGLLFESQDDMQSCSENTVFSLDSISSSYCAEMLAQAKELRNARLTLGKPMSIESISSSNPAITHKSTHCGYELVQQMVKQRKARLSDKLNGDDAIGKIVSSESSENTSSTSAKRQRAMDKIRRNKMMDLN